DRALSAVLLAQRIDADRTRDPLPQGHVQRAAVDRQSLQQCFSRRARPEPVRSGTLMRRLRFWIDCLTAHPRERGGPGRHVSAVVWPWIPAFAGMSGVCWMRTTLSANPAKAGRG